MTLQSGFRFMLKLPLRIYFLLFTILLLLFLTPQVLFLLFFAFILVSAMLPGVEYLQKKGLAKPISVIVVYLLLLVPLAIFVFAFAPVLVSQIMSLVNSFSQYLNKFTKLFEIQTSESEIRTFLLSKAESLVSSTYVFVSSFLGFLFTTVTFIFISFYLLLDYQSIKEKFVGYLGSSPKTKSYLKIIEEKLGHWARAQILLSLFVGGLSFLVYLVVGLPYAIALAIFAGLMEFIPIIGPFLGFIPALIISISISPLTFIWTILGYMAVQTIEGNILIPKIMQKQVGLHPVAVMLTLIIGAKIFGILGAFVAVPFVTVVWAAMSAKVK